MKLDKIAFEIEVLEESLKKLRNKRLIEIAQNYRINFEQILVITAVPLFLMTHGYKSLKHFQYWLQGSMATKNVGKEKTAKAKKEIEDYIKKKMIEENDDHVKIAGEEIQKLREKYEFLTNAFRSIGLNTIVNSWTIFESTTIEIWTFLLNEYPKLFIHNLLRRFDSKDQEIEGILGKNISISLLAKFNFNISNNLGDLLVGKYDFTSTSGIKRAFSDLLNISNSELDFLTTTDLMQLEITRHLIVHKAGKIDSDYLKRSNRKNEKELSDINLSDQDLNNFCNAAIFAGNTLINLVDEKITTVHHQDKQTDPD